MVKHTLIILWCEYRNIFAALCMEELRLDFLQGKLFLNFNLSWKWFKFSNFKDLSVILHLPSLFIFNGLKLLQSLLLSVLLNFCLIAIWLPNFGPCSRGWPLLLNVNHILHFEYSTQRSLEATWRGWVPKPGRAPSRIWTRNLLILISTP